MFHAEAAAPSFHAFPSRTQSRAYMAPRARSTAEANAHYYELSANQYTRVYAPGRKV